MAEETIELGTFEVRASDDDGAEVRLADSRQGSNLVLRKKTVGRELPRGAKYKVTAMLVSEAEEEMVTVQMPADETAGLTPHAKVIEEASAKKAKK